MNLMRQLEAEHKSFWDGFSQNKTEMEKEQDCDPSLLSGWTDKNLSLWNISNKEGKPRLDQILVAICRKKKNWEKVSYILFPKEVVSLTGLNLTQCNGKTGDPWVDISGTHFEIRDITGKKLCTLIFHVSRSEFTTGVFRKKDMEKILFDSYDSTKKNQVINSDTSQTPASNISTSGSELQVAAATTRSSEIPPIEYLGTKQIPSSPPSSSK